MASARQQRFGRRLLRNAVALNDVLAAKWGTSSLPPQVVREALGAKVFDSYFKFTVARNPWDQLVSAYRFWRFCR